MGLIFGKFGSETEEEKSARVVAAVAAVNDRLRLQERQDEATTSPRSSLTSRGDGPTVRSAIHCYEKSPIRLPGGIVGIRLFFARMSDEHREWKTDGPALLRQCGELYVLQPENQDTDWLWLSNRDGLIRRVVDPDLRGARITERYSRIIRGQRLG